MEPKHFVYTKHQKQTQRTQDSPGWDRQMGRRDTCYLQLPPQGSGQLRKRCSTAMVRRKVRKNPVCDTIVPVVLGRVRYNVAGCVWSGICQKQKRTRDLREGNHTTERGPSFPPSKPRIFTESPPWSCVKNSSSSRATFPETLYGHILFRGQHEKRRQRRNRFWGRIEFRKWQKALKGQGDVSGYTRFWRKRS